jgi:hypothetical protein
LSDEAEDQSGPIADDHGAAELPRPERPKLRRRPLGYKRADVDEAFEVRDSELAEMRQDIAALWLAFAQHDRMIRALGGVSPPPLTQPPQDAPPSRSPVEAEAASIGSQLSELDEVLAAIEMATQTLERTYSDETEASEGASEEVEESAVDPEESPTEDPEGEKGTDGD